MSALYLPTVDDLKILKLKNKSVYVKVELLDRNYLTLAELNGVTIDLSLSINANSDIRRTLSLTMTVRDDSLLLGEMCIRDRASMIQLNDGKTLQSVFDEAILVTDWNDAIKPGMYFSLSDAANEPPSLVGDDWFGQVFAYDDRVKQILTHASSAPIGKMCIRDSTYSGSFSSPSNSCISFLYFSKSSGT